MVNKNPSFGIGMAFEIARTGTERSALDIAGADAIFAIALYTKTASGDVVEKTLVNGAFDRSLFDNGLNDFMARHYRDFNNPDVRICSDVAQLASCVLDFVVAAANDRPGSVPEIRVDPLGFYVVNSVFETLFGHKWRDLFPFSDSGLYTFKPSSSLPFPTMAQSVGPSLPVTRSALNCFYYREPA